MATYTIDEVKIESAYPISKILELSMRIGVNKHGYESKTDTANYSYGVHKHPSFTFPPAYIDGKDIKWYSVMVSKYWNNEFFEDPQNPLPPPTRPFTRTALDYEMLLFAWRDNELQCYVDRILENKSQAFYH